MRFSIMPLTDNDALFIPPLLLLLARVGASVPISTSVVPLVPDMPIEVGLERKVVLGDGVITEVVAVVAPPMDDIGSRSDSRDRFRLPVVLSTPDPYDDCMPLPSVCIRIYLQSHILCL